MSLKLSDTQEFRQLIRRLQLMSTPKELEYISKSLNYTLNGIKILATFPTNEPNSLYSFRFPNSFSNKYVVPYLCHPNIYYYHHTPLLLPGSKKIDYTIAFDTQTASYIKAIVKNQTLQVLSGKILLAFEHILMHDLNFDSFFYFVENIKLAHPIFLTMKKRGTFTPLEFWDALNDSFKSTIVCLQIFNSVDCSYYKNTHTLRFSITYQEAERKAIDLAYNFYASPEKGMLANDQYFPTQRLILLQLLAIIRIQFSSEKSVKEKFAQFLSFVQESGVVYLERESFIALEYFKKRLSIPILNHIKKGTDTKHLLKVLDNIAWDFSAIRFLEGVFSAQTGGDCYIPLFLSFDDNLRHLFRVFPVKAVVYDMESGYVHSISEIDINKYLSENKCLELMNEFLSIEKTIQRRAKIINEDRETLSRIRIEYKLLLSVLNN